MTAANSLELHCNPAPSTYDNYTFFFQQVFPVSVVRQWRSDVTALTEDKAVDLALLHAAVGQANSPAAFAARTARLNSDVTVVG
jgi:hypothetical protein